MIVEILVLIVLIPIGVFAAIKLGVDIYVPPTNEEIRDSLENEKQEYLNRAKEEEANSLNQPNTTSEEEKKEIKQLQTESENEEKAIITIINKFYPNELATIRERIETEGNTLYENSVPDAVKDLYYLIIEVLETKQLTQEEQRVLKDFLDNAYSNIKTDTQLRARIEGVLSK